MCPQCGTTQAVGLNVNPSGPLPTPHWFRQICREFLPIPVLEIAPLKSWLLCVFVVALGGLLGYWIAEGVGAYVGVIVFAVGLVIIKIIQEERQ